MPKEWDIIKYNNGEKSRKVPFIIYESLLNTIGTCHNNPEESSTTKIIKHIPCGCSHCLHTVYLMLQKISLIILEAKTV